jgi:hypothetical protein
LVKKNKLKRKKKKFWDKKFLVEKIEKKFLTKIVYLWP